MRSLTEWGCRRACIASCTHALAHSISHSNAARGRVHDRDVDRVRSRVLQVRKTGQGKGNGACSVSAQCNRDQSSSYEPQSRVDPNLTGSTLGGAGFPAPRPLPDGPLKTCLLVLAGSFALFALSLAVFVVRACGASCVWVCVVVFAPRALFPTAFLRRTSTWRSWASRRPLATRLSAV